MTTYLHVVTLLNLSRTTDIAYLYSNSYSLISIRRENTNKITYTVYNRMGVLLKSLISVSRVTPAYKIARKQGHDYILCYR